MSTAPSSKPARISQPLGLAAFEESADGATITIGPVPPAARVRSRRRGDTPFLFNYRRPRLANPDGMAPEGLGVWVPDPRLRGEAMPAAVGAEATGNPLTAADYLAAEQQFRRDLDSRAISLPSGRFVQGMPADGRWPRANATNKNGTSGRGDAQYICNLRDGWPRWTIINYTDGRGWSSGYYYKTDRELTAEERAAVDRAIEENRKRADEQRAKQEQRWLEVAKMCRQRWDTAQPAEPTHPYLVRKAVKPYGIRQIGTRLLVPMIGPDGLIWSLQTITPAGDKKYAKGGRSRYGVFVIPAANPEAGTAYVCEGYATGASITEVTGCGVIVSFDSGKLKAGGARARQEFPGRRIVFAADDDWKVDGNPGIAKAWEAAEEIGAVVAVPVFGPGRAETDTDFNDLRRLKGDEAVRTALESRSLVTRPQSGVIVWRDKRDKYGNPQASLANAVLAVKALGIVCRLDLFHHVVLVGYRDRVDELKSFIGELSDHTIGAIRSLINNTYRVDVGDANTRAAVLEIARANAFDPILDYLTEVQGRWDGKKRLDTWLIDYCGAPDTPFIRAVGRKHMIASVRRARRPGCKYDDILVMESPEGRNKSTAIELLAGKENFSDQTILGVSDKEAQELVTGVWLYEIADLTDIGKAEVNRVKAFASRNTDRARPAYGHVKENRPRRGTFWATTNDKTYLKSQTGNRRFLPTPVGRIDLEALGRDRDQLWAEAAVAEAAGESIFLAEELWGVAAIEQESRRTPDPWEDLLADIPGIVYVGDPLTGDRKQIIWLTASSDAEAPWQERVSSADLMTYVLRIPPAQQTPVHGQRLALIMERKEWRRTDSGVLKIDGKSVRGYWRKAEPPPF